MTPPPHGQDAARDADTVPAATALVLFDLDGTLADSAPDLAGAVNACLEERGLAPRPLEELRPWASHGARGLIGRAFGYRPGDAQYEPVREEFLQRYEASLFGRTSLFPGVDDMLARIEAAGLRWGIVTNKVARFTQPLVRALGLEQRAACIVSGDTAARPKPDPAPILYALAHCACAPRNSVYVGDDRRDIEAGRAAGVRTIAAAYGYSAAMDDITQWQADHIVHSAPEVLRWVLAGSA